jgi:transposase
LEDEIEVVIGVDAHKRTHTMVACDRMGREVAVKTVEATTEGHLVAVEWASRWPRRRWAVEDCRHLTRRLERDLLRAGETLARVPTKMMADTRRSARQAGQSDPIDATAVARAAWREPNLPTATLDGPQRELRLLVDHREDLVRERTRVQARVRWHLLEIDPSFQVRPRGLRSQRLVGQVLAHLAGRDGLLVEIARELLQRIRELNQRALELERAITKLVRRLAPSLLQIPGCGALSAAKIVGETAGAARFFSKSAYARWNGTAPQPVWSGNKTRFRLTRSGNRQVNSALHLIAITQARVASPGRDYLKRRMESGNTKTEALRLLRRRLSDVIFRALLADESASPIPAVTPRPRGRRPRRAPAMIICNSPLP